MTHLEWSTSQNQPVPGRVVLVQCLRQLRLDILHSVSFIDNHVDPFDLGQERSFLDDVFVGRHADLEIARSDTPILLTSSQWGSLEHDSPDSRCPSLEFHCPIGQSRERDNDEKWSWLTLSLDQIGNE